ncbi:MAG: amidase domain-containing protein [Clostridia bacterium]|nr:amidase domain-containing protein [Clostridia bacterium]
MRVIPYNRTAAVAYARRWAFARNPAYYDFSGIGGDCTNFASQCLFAGCNVMNYTPDVGWFYNSPTDRAAAWTGVEFFYRFLMNNRGSPNTPVGVGNGAGPFAEDVGIEQLELGDFVQFGRQTGDFYHTPIVVGFSGGEPLLAAHTYDAFDRPLSSYRFDRLRCLHILGARTD